MDIGLQAGSDGASGDRLVDQQTLDDLPVHEMRIDDFIDIRFVHVRVPGASGYTTTTGPDSQRSMQPALLMRTLPSPARASCFTRFFAYSCMDCALQFAQLGRSASGARWFRQKNTWYCRKDP